MGMPTSFGNSQNIEARNMTRYRPNITLLCSSIVLYEGREGWCSPKKISHIVLPYNPLTYYAKGNVRPMAI